MATNLNLTDMETCYKAFRREIIQGIDIEEDRFGFEPEVTAKIARSTVGSTRWGSATTVAPTTTEEEYDDGKKIGWRDGVRAVFCIAAYSPPGVRFGSASEPDVARLTGS